MSDIVRTPNVMGGQPRIEGHRISVVQVVEWVHEESMDPETVATEFEVDLADVYRALAYYYDNVEELSELRDQREKRVRESRERQPSVESVSETV